LNTANGIISGTTPNVTFDTVFNFIAQVTDSSPVPLSTTSPYYILVALPIPVELTIGGPGTSGASTLISNRAFFIEYEEDITNAPAITISGSSIISNKTFFVEYEEDITNSPTLTITGTAITSNRALLTPGFIAAGPITYTEFSFPQTVAPPTGILQGDLLILVTSGGVTPAPAGWTQLAAQLATNFLTILYKYAGPAESAVTLNYGSSGTAVILAYRHMTIGPFATAFRSDVSLSTQPNTPGAGGDLSLGIFVIAGISGAYTPTPNNAITRVEPNQVITQFSRGAFLILEASNPPFTATISSPVSRQWSSVSIGVNFIAENPYSFNGFTTPAQMNNSSAYAYMSSVAVNSAGLFVAVGFEGFGAPLYATSSNGSTWTTPGRMNNSSVAAYMNSVVVNSSGLFVAVGTSGTDPSRAVYATSSNGSTWTTPALMPNGGFAVTMESIAVNSSGLFVAIGRSNTADPSYATSSNGSTWSTPAKMPTGSVNAYMESIAVNSSGLFVAVGSTSGATQYPVYATSSNGSTWSAPALVNNSSVTAPLTSVAVNSAGLFVAVGYDSSGAPVYATSSNGSTWSTPARMNNSSTIARMQAITVDSTGLFVAVGTDANTSPVYATSSNGSTWTTPAQMNNSSAYAYMSSVAVNSAGLFVAVGVDNSTYPLYTTST
jgi:hypothetical protein